MAYIYRINKKIEKEMKQKWQPFINLIEIKNLLNIEDLKKNVPTTNKSHILRVYIDACGMDKILQPHKYFRWNHNNNLAIYGNVIIVLSDKLYDELPFDIKINHIDKINMTI